MVNASAGEDVLDVACGTGDFAQAFTRAGVRSVVGCDFAHEMLVRVTNTPIPFANPKGEKASRLEQTRFLLGANNPPLSPLGKGGGMIERHMNTEIVPERPPTFRIRTVEADALALPFADALFSIVSCAFGVRNFSDLIKGLMEMGRVLRPGGRLVILEFTRPTNRAVRFAYEIYAERVMPIAASLLSRDRTGAYRYLPRSVVSFLSASQMMERLRAAGFSKVSATPLTFGIVTVYVGIRD